MKPLKIVHTVMDAAVDGRLPVTINDTLYLQTKIWVHDFTVVFCGSGKSFRMLPYMYFYIYYAYDKKEYYTHRDTLMMDPRVNCQARGYAQYIEVIDKFDVQFRKSNFEIAPDEKLTTFADSIVRKGLESRWIINIPYGL